MIKQKNELIEKNEMGYYYNNYFLLVKYDIPFFRGEFEKYVNLFEFMNIPGLNKAPDITINPKNEKYEYKNTLIKIFILNILIQHNIKF